jgi:tRNA threonylcarbamoyladenosine biosynthesis protein TsaB
VAWVALDACALMAPRQVAVQAADLLAGNAFEPYHGQLPVAARAPCPAWPTARALLSLAPGLWAAGHAVDASQALPLYIRDKVAQSTQEREAARALKAAGTTP